MTYYEILGVLSNATDREIREAYHNLSFAFRPDTYQGKNKDFASR